MSTVYQMRQIANADLLDSENSKLIVQSLPPKSYTDDIQNSQQLIFYRNNNEKFEKGKTYLIKANILPDRNYDFNFGIRLMNLESITNDDLSIKSNFQLIKYISIPRINNAGTDTSIVWLYHIKKTDGNPATDPFIEVDITKDFNVGTFDNIANQIVVNAAVAVHIENFTNFNETYINTAYSSEQRKNKFFYSHNPEVLDPLVDVIWLYDNDGNLIKENENPKNYFNIIQKNSILLSQNFDSGGAVDRMPLTRYFTITPEDDCNIIYLYLKPIPEDVDIQWTIEVNNNKYNMFGRHIDLTPIEINTGAGTKTIYPVEGFCWELNNILGTLGTTNSIKSIGVWGRPEQIMAINGQEIRIGPSGYFELKDLPSAFKLTELCIANTEEGDRYTVDVEYEVEVND